MDRFDAADAGSESDATSPDASDRPSSGTAPCPLNSAGSGASGAHAGSLAGSGAATGVGAAIIPNCRSGDDAGIGRGHDIAVATTGPGPASGSPTGPFASTGRSRQTGVIEGGLFAAGSEEEGSTTSIGSEDAFSSESASEDTDSSASEDTDSTDLSGRSASPLGDTPLDPILAAAVLGVVEGVRDAINAEGSNRLAAATRTDEAGRSPLFFAAKHGHVAAVRFLVTEAGVNVNTPDAQGRTPLSQAASNGHVGVARFLVTEAGANANQTDDQQRSPLWMAAKNGHDAALRFLATLPGAVDVNQADDDGRTPLFVAAREGHETVVRFLITEAGADVNKTRRGGYTPLYVAAQDGHVGVVRLLVKEGGVDPSSTLTDDGVDVLCVDFDISFSGVHPARFRQRCSCTIHIRTSWNLV